jgi:hypothetical protein
MLFGILFYLHIIVNLCCCLIWLFLFWILSPCCILYPVHIPPLFCVSPTQRRIILHTGTLTTEQPEKIPGVAGPPSLLMLGIFILCRSYWRWALRWVDLIVSLWWFFCVTPLFIIRCLQSSRYNKFWNWAPTCCICNWAWRSTLADARSIMGKYWLWMCLFSVYLDCVGYCVVIKVAPYTMLLTFVTSGFLFWKYNRMKIGVFLSSSQELLLIDF